LVQFQSGFNNLAISKRTNVERTKRTKMKTTNKIKAEFYSLKLERIFEIQVVEKSTGEIDHIIFEIEIVGNEFRAYHEPLTTEQINSEKIAFCSVEIDPDFSLDANLTELFSECQQAIIDSEFFELGDE
jgi:hypothetical protein